MSARRVAVVFDAAPRSRPALDAIARLAARLEGELSAVFVEDVGLLHWAALPFTREVELPTASRREFDVIAMERALRASAEGLRRLVEAAAAGASVPWNFRVERGVLITELLRAAADADLVMAEPVERRLTAICHATAPAGIFDGIVELTDLPTHDLDVVLLGEMPPAGGNGEQRLRAQLAQRAGGRRLRVVRAARDEDLRALLGAGAAREQA